LRISRNVLQWISSFLSNRSQKVLVEGQHSTPAPVTSGVPQGITRKRTPVNTTYLIHDHPLQLVKQGKYLGVILSDKLSWTPHIEMVTKKANNTLAFLHLNISRCPRDVKARCCKSLVCPNLEYASSAWDPNNMSNIQQLEAVQRRAAHFVSGGYHTTSSVSHMISTIGWKSLQHRRQLSKLVMLYRITNQLVAIYSHTFNLRL